MTHKVDNAVADYWAWRQLEKETAIKVDLLRKIKNEKGDAASLHEWLELAHFLERVETQR